MSLKEVKVHEVKRTLAKRTDGAKTGKKPKIKATRLTDEQKEIIKDAIETSMSYVDLTSKLQGRFQQKFTKPTIIAMAKNATGMSSKEIIDKFRENRVNKRRWLKEFQIARQNINPVFWKDYLTTDDGVVVNWESGELELLPPPHKRRDKDIVNFTASGEFGYIYDPEDMEKLNTYDPRTRFIFEKRLRALARARTKYDQKVLINATIAEELEKAAKLRKKVDRNEVAREVRKKLKPDLENIARKYDKVVNKILKDLKTDKRTKILHERDGPIPKVDENDKSTLEPYWYHVGDIMNLRLDPATASSDKTERGRWRVLALPNKPFSRVIYNLPKDLLMYNHEKRVQIYAHNSAKKLPYLYEWEYPKWRGQFTDIKGHNVRFRLPKNIVEDLLTREAGMIVSKSLAKKFRYFYPAEEGSLVAPMPPEFIGRKGPLGPDEIRYIYEVLPRTIRIDSKIKDHSDFEENVLKRNLKPQWVERMDVLSVGGFEEISDEAGTAFARHSGYIIFTGLPKRMYRKLTKSRGVSGNQYMDVHYYKQPYQIIRVDELKVGDKIIGRAGEKGVVSDIWDDRKMGKDEKGRPYEAIINYEEVWRDTDDPLKKETYFKLGKYRSGIPVEHKKSDGTNFMFMIDKFSQDNKAWGVRFSPTLITGLWEIFEDKYAPHGTRAELKTALRKFIDSFFLRQSGNLIPTLKALHLKAEKKNNIIRIVPDPNEPEPDSNGEVYYLPHMQNGRFYNYVYVPHYIPRAYFDGERFIETFRTINEVPYDQIPESMRKSMNYWWDSLKKQVKKHFFIFPKSRNAVQMTLVEYVDPDNPTDYNIVRMDYLDVIELGANPFDPNLKITLRKEPVTAGTSIQTHKVKVDFSGKYRNTLGIHPYAAVAGTMDFDGDTVAVMYPPITEAKLKLPDDKETELKSLLKKSYNVKMEDLYDEAEKLKYHKDENELAVKMAKYNQEIAKKDSTMIKRLGGLRKRALVLLNLNGYDTITIGDDKEKETYKVDVKLINKVTDVEKVLKMREPMWLVKKLKKKKWSELTPEEKDIVRDFHLRDALEKKLREYVKENPEVNKLIKLLREQRSIFDEQGAERPENDPSGLVLNLNSGRILDYLVYTQLAGSDVLEDYDGGNSFNEG